MSDGWALHDKENCCCGTCANLRRSIAALNGEAEWETAKFGDTETKVRRVSENPRSTILSEAEALVYGDRGKAYGHPKDDYTRTAALWTALLRGKLKEDLTPQDAILCMIAVKMSREVNLPGVDNRRDLAGYALCLDRVETGL